MVGDLKDHMGIHTGSKKLYVVYLGPQEYYRSTLHVKLCEAYTAFVNISEAVSSLHYRNILILCI